MSKLLCSTVAEPTRQRRRAPQPPAAAPADGGNEGKPPSAAPHEADCARRAEPKLDAAPAAVETCRKPPRRYAPCQANSRCRRCCIRSRQRPVPPAALDEPAGVFQGIKPHSQAEGKKSLPRARVPIIRSPAATADPNTKPAPAAAPKRPRLKPLLYPCAESLPRWPEAPADIEGATSTRPGIADIRWGPLRAALKHWNQPREGGAELTQASQWSRAEDRADLNALGSSLFDQIARWTATEIAWVDARLPFARGRHSTRNELDGASKDPRRRRRSRLLWHRTKRP